VTRRVNGTMMLHLKERFAYTQKCMDVYGAGKLTTPPALLTGNS
jgi:hypothetical protein